MRSIRLLHGISVRGTSLLDTICRSLDREGSQLMMSMGSLVTFLCVLATASVAVDARPPAWARIETAEAAAKQLTQTIAEVKKLAFPRHCGDLLKIGQKTSGVYTVFHDAADPSGQKVYCDMDTDGGGWTVVERRGQFGNDVFYFNRNWEKYASGFGDPAKEYWIGNRALHALTAGDETMALRVVLGNMTHDSVSVNYASIRTGSETELFQMDVGKFLGPRGWDSLSSSNGTKFSTFDRDNDGAKDSNCAEMYRGGWWYNACYRANLNGLNLNGRFEGKIGGVAWADRGGSIVYRHSYPSAVMLIRRTDLE